MTATLTRPRPHEGTTGKGLGLLALSLATFSTYLDNNIVNVAIPTIQRHLHLSDSGIEWVVSAYVVCFAGLLLAGGRLADVLGRRRVFVAGLTLFTLASLGAGLAGSVGALIAARAGQGIGAALLSPAAMALITDLFPDPDEQQKAFGAAASVGALALAVGPLLGGVLSAHAGWQWIFFVNVPVGALTLALTARAVPERGPATPGRRLDGPGVASSSVALLALTWALIEGPQIGWTAPPTLTALALAALALPAFLAFERRSADPMLDLSVFADRRLSGAVAALALWAFGLFGIYFFTAIYLQDVLGFSSTKAGLAFVPMALLMAAGAAVAQPLGARVGTARMVGAAYLLMALGIAWVAFLGTHVGFVDLMAPFACFGIGGGLTIPMTTVVVNGMPAERAGMASAVFNASRELAGLLGITVIGVVLTARRHAELRAGHGQLAAFLSGYRLGVVVAAVLVASGGAVAFASLRRAEA